MPPKREPIVTYSVRVPASLDERVTAVRLRSGESASAFVLRAIKLQLAQDEAEKKTQGHGEGAEEKR